MQKKIQDELHFAFNIWDTESAVSVIDAAGEFKKDVILQTSVSIYKELDQRTFRDYMKHYAKARGITAWLNLDHCMDTALAKDAADNGWDMVMLDASRLPLEENIRLTNDICRYAHPKGVLVEAEVGRIQGTEDSVCVIKEDIASIEEVLAFLESAQADFIAAAFGNAHGSYGAEPVLHYEIVKQTVASGVPFVVHGASGFSDQVLHKLVSAGVKKINISTELKLAYYNALQQAAEKGLMQRHGFQPRKVIDLVHDEIADTVKRKMILGYGRQNWEAENGEK